jgi:hypothetical protein
VSSLRSGTILGIVRWRTEHWNHGGRGEHGAAQRRSKR